MKNILFVIMALVLAFAGSNRAFAADKKATSAPPSAAPMYWDKWEHGMADGVIPPCGVDETQPGRDDILEATIETYCALKPGKYLSYISPAAMKVYKSRGTAYPDGKTAVLVFREIGIAFSTDHKDGKPVYDVLSLTDGGSVASKIPGHPLNPALCARCHIGFKGICKGFVCGNRN